MPVLQKQPLKNLILVPDSNRNKNYQVASVLSDKCLDCPHGLMEWIRSDSSSVFGHHREHHSVTKTLARRNATPHIQTLSSTKLPRTRFQRIITTETTSQQRGRVKTNLGPHCVGGGGARARTSSFCPCLRRLG